VLATDTHFDQLSQNMTASRRVKKTSNKNKGKILRAPIYAMAESQNQKILRSCPYF